MILQSAEVILIEVWYKYIIICQEMILFWIVQKNYHKNNIENSNQFSDPTNN